MRLISFQVRWERRPNRFQRFRSAGVRGAAQLCCIPFLAASRRTGRSTAYRALAERLPLPVEWTAGPEEALEEAHRFEDLGDLARWLSGAALYIGNDSGITHLAAAVGVPTLALFGPTDPAVWGPRGEQVSILRNATLDQASDAANRLLR